jgi:hypothetical protein
VVTTQVGRPKARVTYYPEDDEWELCEDFTYFDPITARAITAWAGLRYDLASVPQVLWWALGSHQLSVEAATIHDWLYKHGGLLPPTCVVPFQHEFTRAEADRIFRDMMLAYHVRPDRREVAFWAVRLRGARHWKG